MAGGPRKRLAHTAGLFLLESACYLIGGGKLHLNLF